MATIEKVASFEAPGHPGSPVELKPRYENFVGGHWIAPVHGEYVENLTPATGEAFTFVAPDDADEVVGAVGEVAAVQGRRDHGRGAGARLQRRRRLRA